MDGGWRERERRGERERGGEREAGKTQTVRQRDIHTQKASCDRVALPTQPYLITSLVNAVFCVTVPLAVRPTQSGAEGRREREREKREERVGEAGGEGGGREREREGGNEGETGLLQTLHTNKRFLFCRISQRKASM